MAKYLLKRLGMAVLTLFVILLLLFIMVHSLPGSPFNNAEKLTEAQKAAMNAKYGLDKPLLTQFFIYFSNILKGDFGTSYSFASDIPISTILKGRVSTSFKIGGLSVLIGAVIGLFIGITAALNRDKFMDTFCTVLSIVGVSVPSYVFMMLLMNLLGVKGGVLPVLYTPKRPFESAVMPAISLSLFTVATISRFTRNEMCEVMDSDYILLAESKGLYGNALIARHVLRNALIPIVTVLAPLIVDLLTGALVVEKIYAIDGIGKLMVDAVSANDYNIIMAISFLYSALYIVVMLAVDLLYGLIDPRVRVAKGENGA